MAPTPDRWQKIEALYHSALERDPAARGAFLEGACGEDGDLRREVESLLAEFPPGGGLLDRPLVSLLTEGGTIALKSGTRLGRYQIEGPIGEGGMGKVYRAHDTRLGRTVAIKTCSARFSERFEREARAVAALNHPHICHLYDVGPDYLVMEYVEGTPLKGPLPVDQALKYAEQICDALDAAHRGGIIHHDLKPGNILLSKQGIKLLDFGLAKMQSGPDDPTQMHMTQRGEVMGTPAYMAPEQWEGKRDDARSDIYAFGCVLYEMLTGKRAVADRMAAVPRSAAASPDLERIVSKCLENDPELRYQHASEISTDLRRLKRDTDSARETPGPTPVVPARITRGRVIATGATALALLAAGYFFSSLLHGKPKLTDKDTIVLADFTNTTGDPVFDGALRQGLSVQLEQSPFLSLVSDQSIQKTLGLMGQPADSRLTSKLAAEICERTASAAVLDGSIASLGSQYVVGLRARNCRTGDVLDEEQAQAARKEDVLNALSQIASKFRSRVGESLTMLQKHDAPLAEATTPSLDALKAYSAGMKVLFSKGSAAAVPSFKRAIELDPKFAMAHAFLGRVYGDIGESDLSADSTRTAWQLRDRTSDAEKFFISANYDLNVTGNMEKAQENFELWEQTYPRDIHPPGLLSGMIYPTLGKHEKAIEEAKKAIVIDPGIPFAYVNLATSYQFLGRLEEAESTFQRAHDRKVDLPDFLVQQLDLAFVKGDQAEMERISALGHGKSGVEDSLSDKESFVLAYSGHVQQARKKSQLAVDLTRKAGQPERTALFGTGAAVLEALFGNALVARRGAMAALELSKGRDVEYGAALALALSGDSLGSQKLANDLEKRFPEDTSVQFSYLPELRALLALHPPLNQKGDPARAIELLQVAVPYELGTPGSWGSGQCGILYPVYVRGLSYLAAHQGAEAVAEFQKILDHRGIVASDPIGALAHLQLGRALVLSGDKAKAKTAYHDFLALWKDADPDIPVLQQAKAEYVRL